MNKQKTTAVILVLDVSQKNSDMYITEFVTMVTIWFAG